MSGAPKDTVSSQVPVSTVKPVHSDPAPPGHKNCLYREVVPVQRSQSIANKVVFIERWEPQSIAFGTQQSGLYGEVVSVQRPQSIALEPYFTKRWSLYGGQNQSSVER